ncbi:MAG: AMP nucleosidase [Alphaproteobacteria bacterium]|nr:AMP nucleosidase [Alphaproteobacteria bacterium]
MPDESRNARPGSVATFTDADEALAAVQAIYDANCAFLRERFAAYARGEAVEERITRCYPYVEIKIEKNARVDTRLAYGFVAGPGTYATTLTRPDLFSRYYREQFQQLLKNHGQPITIGVSWQPIPIQFAFAEAMHVEGRLVPERLNTLRDVFDLPDLVDMDDSIVNGTHVARAGGPTPLAMFTAPRVDYSLHRLAHYTATQPDMFQNYVLFTNYQFYVDEFVRIGHELMQSAGNAEERKYRSQYVAFCEPGNRITYNANLGAKPPVGEPAARLPQMPAYHLMRDDACGITMVNIGIGPSNAKTITDHVAVLRPHVWLMLGHCAGLRRTQQLGDYVLAHGYVRDDHVLDADLPISVPVPPLAEVQVALETAVARVSGLSGYELKRIMRTGTVATIDNRNWELRDQGEITRRLSQSRAVALDMESATIAANGFRFRVPYGTLLCVSDRPLHGELKLQGMANQFYRERVDQHLKIGMLALELMRGQGLDRLHSRKLRAFAESAFQ